MRNEWPKISEGGDVKMTIWPAYTYVESTNPDAPICVDEGGEHLGKKVPGVAVAMPSGRYGELHKHFGIGEDEAGNVYTYGKATSITAEKRAHVILGAARIGSKVIYKGKVYEIAPAPNSNIELIPVD